MILLIFLVGYMGCGKSTIGPLLASQMNLPLRDSDHIVSEKHSKSIDQIFSEDGEEVFRNYESDFLHNIDEESAIVSTGGGMPCFNDNMDLIKSKGLSFYIYLPAANLASRLSESSGRPIIERVDLKERQSFIYDHLTERNPFYFQSHFIVNGLQSPQEIVDDILSHISNYQAYISQRDRDQ